MSEKPSKSSTETPTGSLLSANSLRSIFSSYKPVGDRVNDNSTPFEPVKIIDKQSLDYIARSGIAGGIAGSAAKTLVAPLDRVKILFQTSNPEFIKYRGSTAGLWRAGKVILQNDGPAGLYQGHSVTLLRIFPYAAIKFVAYEQIRTLLIPNDDMETAARRFMAGSLSGLSSVFLTYPLDLIRVRMAFETKNLTHHTHQHKQYISHRRGQLYSTVRTIFHENPPHSGTDPLWVRFFREKLPKSVSAISNFYRGFAPTILGMVPYAGVSFYTHDLFHDLFRSKHLYHYLVQGQDHGSSSSVSIQSAHHQVNSRDSRAPLRAYAQLIAGGLAGMCSQTAAYPFEVVRRRMQVGGAVGQGQFLSLKQTASIIFKEMGFRGFFVGLSIGYIKVVPMSSCSFYVYERSKMMLGI
ncbi:mitochondrial carrier [Yamadazyma tenuis ATCC 10573]|uniref:Mitochondrial thiamine pyrophosphate carrier 1 n=1 Tax=Candida tenuis (strain ATCC 10573 / BCRC 21748 / CBS 615 / JCM 9827 / NBRC 10315 / NRRL Y-1498 / VKM Y-70) TaxID=590646 RepID=G3BF82_CANTC|nr:mitochondrial carrier [Yamadazyma tenuis ATCC 10573]EGV59994.1 mitochondrial carrier [Yamadazyma tenuis ATCC 10573]